ncbi:MAG: ribosome silencing factor [Limnohabitans sp.]|nr:ribosome silencing factor [Limnohabitans sp.]
MTEVFEKKDVQKLQRIVVDSLEDVKAQDIAVFNTEHLSPLFERVIIASGTSNRQTKALAANVRDDVRDGGFGKPRIEGKENGEWIIVDCGSVVVHIMQPTIRQYYHLEEIWGDKPVRIKLGAPQPKPVTKAVEVVEPAAAKSTRKPAAKTSTGKGKSAATKSTGVAKPPGTAKKTAASGTNASARKPSTKAPVKKVIQAKPVAVKKPAAKKTASGKSPARKPRA